MSATATPTAWPTLEERLMLDDLLQACAAALDEQRYDDWPGFFRDDALYRIVPKENHDLGLPLALLHCEGRGMMADRVTAIKEAAMIRPRTLRGGGASSCARRPASRPTLGRCTTRRTWFPAAARRQTNS